MMHDLGLCATLKLRHLRTSFARMVFYILDSDVLEEKAWLDRLYQLYGAALLVVWAVVMWWLLTDTVTTTFLSMGSEISLSILGMAAFIPALIFIGLGIRFLRSTPLKLSKPDILFVAASSLKTSSIVFCEVAGKLLVWGIVGFFFGYLLGIGMQNGLGMPLGLVGLSLCCAFLFSAGVLWAWVLGVLRLAKGSGKTLLLVGGSVLAMLVALGLSTLLASGLLVSYSFALSPGAIPLYLALGSALLLLVLGLVVLITASSRIDMTKVVDENSLYADLYDFRHMPLVDSSGYAEIKRRRKIANRGAKVFLPIRAGAGALVSRAVLSHIRQFEGLPNLLFWGVFAAPTATFLLFMPQNIVFWMIWVQVVLAMPKGARETTRVFRDDLRVDLVRAHLPFDSLKLFVLDSLPAFVVVSLISSVSVLFLLPPDQYAWGLLCCPAINVVISLCAGVDGLALPFAQKRMSYEMAVLIFILGSLPVIFTQTPQLIIGIAALYAFFLIQALRTSGA